MLHGTLADHITVPLPESVLLICPLLLCSSQHGLLVLQDGTEKRTKDTYGPPMGKRLMIFLDDLNMPRMDQYGTQQPIALLKLLIDRKVFSLTETCSLIMCCQVHNMPSPTLPHGQPESESTSN